MEKNDAFKQGYYQNALTESFMTLDAEVKGEIYAKETGSTACVVLITPDKIICANAGDSRAVLFSNNKAIGLDVMDAENGQFFVPESCPVVELQATTLN